VRRHIAHARSSARSRGQAKIDRDASPTRRAGARSLVAGIVLMLMLRSYITSNVPMGVPIERNFMVVYGACALFWAHADLTVLDLGSIPLAIFLIVALVAIPILGSVMPDRVSFLLAMRYNAAYGEKAKRRRARKKPA
jgi:hypothetical protein